MKIFYVLMSLYFISCARAPEAFNVKLRKGELPKLNRYDAAALLTQIDHSDALSMSLSYFHQPTTSGEYQAYIDAGIENVMLEYNVTVGGCDSFDARCPNFQKLDAALTAAQNISNKAGQKLHIDLFWQFNPNGSYEDKNSEKIIAGFKNLISKHQDTLTRIWLQLDVSISADRTKGYIRTEEYLRALCGDQSIGCGIATQRHLWSRYYNSFLPPFAGQGIPLMEINYDRTPNRNLFYDTIFAGKDAGHWGRESESGEFISYHGWIEPDAKRWYGSLGNRQVGYDQAFQAATGLQVIKREAFKKDYVPAFLISAANKGNSRFAPNVSDECKRILKESAFKDLLGNLKKNPNYEKSFTRISHAFARREARELCKELNGVVRTTERVCFEDIQALLSCGDDPVWVACNAGCNVTDDKNNLGTDCRESEKPEMTQVCGNTIDLEILEQPTQSIGGSLQNVSRARITPDISQSIDELPATNLPKAGDFSCHDGLRPSLTGSFCYSVAPSAVGACVVPNSSEISLFPFQLAENLGAANDGSPPVFVLTRDGVQTVGSNNVFTLSDFSIVINKETLVCPTGMSPGKDGNACYCNNGTCPVGNQCYYGGADQNYNDYMCPSISLGNAPLGTVCYNGRIPCSQGCCCANAKCGGNCKEECTTSWTKSPSSSSKSPAVRTDSAGRQCMHTDATCRKLDPAAKASCHYCYCPNGKVGFPCYKAPTASFPPYQTPEEQNQTCAGNAVPLKGLGCVDPYNPRPKKFTFNGADGSIVEWTVLDLK